MTKPRQDRIERIIAEAEARHGVEPGMTVRIGLMKLSTGDRMHRRYRPVYRARTEAARQLQAELGLDTAEIAALLNVRRDTLDKAIRLYAEREAMALVEEQAKARARQRNCLKCGRGFPSAWAGERVCSDCKNTAAWRSGEDFSFAVLTGGSR